MGSQQKFVDRVARLFVAKVDDCGFEKVEWWDGRAWVESQGRYNVLHDVLYDRYYARVSLTWQQTKLSSRLSEAGQLRTERSSLSLQNSQGLEKQCSAQAMQELQQLLVEQQQSLKEWSSILASRAEHAEQAREAAEQAGQDFAAALRVANGRSSGATGAAKSKSDHQVSFQEVPLECP